MTHVDRQMTGLVLHAAGCDGQRNPLLPRLVAAASEALGRRHDAVKAIDLSTFRACLSAEERQAYFGPQPLVSDEARVQADQLQGCGSLVFVYVSENGALSCTLKAWLERVLVPGVGFAMEDGKVTGQRLLKIKRIVGIVLHDEPAHVTRRDGDPGRRVLMRTLRPALGFFTRGRWLALNDARTVGPAQADAFVARVGRVL